MSSKPHPATPASFDRDAFTPAPSRSRADGWTAERQVGFIEALAATANVQAACKAVEMSPSSAYELRARPGADSFREAWDIALDYAVHRLGEAALDRALNGTATPVFFRGEQIGERRRYDERLTMFILRMRDPQRFGAWREATTPWHGSAFDAARLAVATARVGIDADMTESGGAVRPRRPLPSPRLLSSREVEALEVAQAQLLVERHEAREDAARCAALDAEDDWDDYDWGDDDGVDNPVAKPNLDT